MRRLTVVGVLCCVAVAFAQPLLFANSKETQSVFLATVTDVHDGDTFTIEFFDDVLWVDSVRIIGIDTPERQGPKARRTKPYARRAQRYLASIILGKQVWLERDVRDRDHHGRLLRHVYLVNEDGTRGQSVGEAMIIAGFAKADPWSPDTRDCIRYALLERAARAAHVGRWHRREKKKAASIGRPIIRSAPLFFC